MLYCQPKCAYIIISEHLVDGLQSSYDVLGLNHLWDYIEKVEPKWRIRVWNGWKRFEALQLNTHWTIFTIRMSPTYSIEWVRIEHNWERMKQGAVHVELLSKSIRNALLWFLGPMQVEHTYFPSAILAFRNLQFAFENMDISNLRIRRRDVTGWVLLDLTNGFSGGIQKWKRDPMVHGSYLLISAVDIFLLKIFQG